ncbi:MAG: beta-lactamase family protein [Gammaproteobacteria bacterium]|nr:beta-lactamase family protein [Gammaproteobacteria bacterium]
MHYAGGDLRSEITSLAQPLVERGETPGIVVGVLSPDGAMQFFGYGVTDEGSGITPNGDTIFALGSLSKGFLGALASTLVAEHVVSWDDTLAQLLPPELPLSADAKKISLLQLATHTSGLPRQPMTFQQCRYFTQFLFTGKNFYRHLDADQVFNYLADFQVPKKIEIQYSNIGYGLLGYVLEHRTGVPLATLLKEKVLAPLGLQNTGYVPEELPGYTTRAHGHAGDQPKFIARGRHVPEWQFTELMKGSAGVYSSARDLLTFAAAHLDANGTRPNPALVDVLQVRVPRRTEAAAVAWMVDEIHGQHITYQFGVVAGYTSYIGLDIDRHTAVVVLQNSFNWTDRIGHKLLARMAYAYDQTLAKKSAAAEDHSAAKAQ